MKLDGKRDPILILPIILSQNPETIGFSFSLGPKKPQSLAQLLWKILSIWQDITAEKNILGGN